MTAIRENKNYRTIETSAKLNAQYLAQILKAHNCRQVVVSPGSRNAPLIIALNEEAGYHAVSVPDERAAAFTALGMCLEKREPAAVICSSGSAIANMYPAVVEAYYQHLPLVLISADRPLELIDQGVGQTIQQEGIFGKHINYEANLLRDPADKLAKQYNQRLINEALIASRQGPVHINVPFDEPLYDRLSGYSEKARVIEAPEPKKTTSYLEDFASRWNASKKVMLLVGQMPADDSLTEAIDELNNRSPFLVLSETVSNLNVNCNIRSIDRLINTLSVDEKQDLSPDLLITMGGEVVSKMVKQFVKDYPPGAHWHLSPRSEVKDTFQLLDGVLSMDELLLFQRMKELAEPKDSRYRDFWIGLDIEKRRKHEEFLQSVEYSDFWVYHKLFELLPADSILHMANSASIRYSQLFDHKTSISHHSNRGTSGIDGCTSTAIGHAMTTGRPVTLITGDVAFLYDSNAFWNDELPAKLRVVVINNSGGNIFRIIKGPAGTQDFERFQETVHTARLQGVAHTFGVDYECASNAEELESLLPGFFELEGSSGPRILEVQTPRLRSPQVLKEYFEFVKGRE